MAADRSLRQVLQVPTDSQNSVAIQQGGTGLCRIIDLGGRNKVQDCIVTHGQTLIGSAMAADRLQRQVLQVPTDGRNKQRRRSTGWCWVVENCWQEREEQRAG